MLPLALLQQAGVDSEDVVLDREPKDDMAVWI
jgi:hypothetical protein